MAIAFNAAADIGNGLSVSSLTKSYTSGSGSNRLLVLGVVGDGTSDLITGATYAGTSLTLIDKQFPTNGASTHRWHYLFYLLAPATGANNFVISASSSCDVITGTAGDYTGVKQSAQPDAHNKQYNGSGSPTSLTTSVTTVANNDWAVLFELGANSPTTAPTAGTGATRRAFDGTYFASGLFDSNGAVAAGSYSMTTNRSATNDIIGQIVGAFSPFVSGGFTPVQRRTLSPIGTRIGSRQIQVS